MPSSFTHIGLLEEVVETLQAAGTSPAPGFDKRNPYLFWGGLGPDFLQFYSADESVFAPRTSFVLRIQEALERVVSLSGKLEEMYAAAALRPLAKDHFESAFQSALADSEDLNALCAELKDEVITRHFDAYAACTLPYQTSYADRSRWCWVHLTRHTRTSDFMRHLWQNSGDDADLRAYTYGYITHCAGDVVGNAYVNALVGGPTRTFWRRHVLVEQWLDASLWHQWRGHSIAHSGAYRRIDFGTSSFSPRLPPKLAMFIADGLRQVYGGLGLATSVPAPSDVDAMYREYFSLVRRTSTLGETNLPSPDVDFDLAALPQDFQDAIDQLATAALGLVPPSSPFFRDVRQAKSFMIDLVNWIALLAILLTLLLGLSLFSLLVLLGALQKIRTVLYVTLMVVHALDFVCRLASALGGAGPPDSRVLGTHLTDITAPEPNSPGQPSLAELTSHYPQLAFVDKAIHTYYLVHPLHRTDRAFAMATEAPQSIPFLPSLSLIQDASSVFIGQANDVQRLMDAATMDSQEVRRHFSDGEGFCSAKNLALHLFGEFEKNGGVAVPNWNLDADRGYGWRCWAVANDGPWADMSFRFE